MKFNNKTKNQKKIMQSAAGQMSKAPEVNIGLYANNAQGLQTVAPLHSNASLARQAKVIDYIKRSKEGSKDFNSPNKLSPNEVIIDRDYGKNSLTYRTVRKESFVNKTGKFSTDDLLNSVKEGLLENAFGEKFQKIFTHYSFYDTSQLAVREFLNGLQYVDPAEVAKDQYAYSTLIENAMIVAGDMTAVAIDATNTGEQVSNRFNFRQDAITTSEAGFHFFVRSNNGGIPLHHAEKYNSLIEKGYVDILQDVKFYKGIIEESKMLNIDVKEDMIKDVLESSPVAILALVPTAEVDKNGYYTYSFQRKNGKEVIPNVFLRDNAMFAMGIAYYYKKAARTIQEAESIKGLETRIKEVEEGNEELLNIQSFEMSQIKALEAAKLSEIKVATEGLDKNKDRDEILETQSFIREGYNKQIDSIIGSIECRMDEAGLSTKDRQAITESKKGISSSGFNSDSAPKYFKNYATPFYTDLVNLVGESGIKVIKGEELNFKLRISKFLSAFLALQSWLEQKGLSNNTVKNIKNFISKMNAEYLTNEDRAEYQSQDFLNTKHLKEIFSSGPKGIDESVINFIASHKLIKSDQPLKRNKELLEFAQDFEDNLDKFEGSNNAEFKIPYVLIEDLVYSTKFYEKFKEFTGEDHLCIYDASFAKDSLSFDVGLNYSNVVKFDVELIDGSTVGSSITTILEGFSVKHKGKIQHLRFPSHYASEENKDLLKALEGLNVLAHFHVSKASLYVSKDEFYKNLYKQNVKNAKGYSVVSKKVIKKKEIEDNKIFGKGENIVKEAIKEISLNIKKGDYVYTSTEEDKIVAKIIGENFEKIQIGVVFSKTTRNAEVFESASKELDGFKWLIKEAHVVTKELVNGNVEITASLLVEEKYNEASKCVIDEDITEIKKKKISVSSVNPSNEVEAEEEDVHKLDLDLEMEEMFLFDLTGKTDEDFDLFNFNKSKEEENGVDDIDSLFSKMFFDEPNGGSTEEEEEEGEGEEDTSDSNIEDVISEFLSKNLSSYFLFSIKTCDDGIVITENEVGAEIHLSIFNDEESERDVVNIYNTVSEEEIQVSIDKDNLEKSLTEVESVVREEITLSKIL